MIDIQQAIDQSIPAFLQRACQDTSLLQLQRRDSQSGLLMVCARGQGSGEPVVLDQLQAPATSMSLLGRASEQGRPSATAACRAVRAARLARRRATLPRDLTDLYAVRRAAARAAAEAAQREKDQKQLAEPDKHSDLQGAERSVPSTCQTCLQPDKLQQLKGDSQLLPTARRTTQAVL